MVFVYCIFTLIPVFILYMLLEASWVQVTRINRSKGKAGFKIVQLSDIHINHLSVSARRLKRIVDRESPDVIIFTGDYIESTKDIPRYLAFHGKITGNRRSIACLGNHDYSAFKKSVSGMTDFIDGLKDIGTEILINSAISIEKGGKQYAFCGIDDLRHGRPDINKALSDIPQDTYMKIGLAHNPDTVLYIGKGKLDYLFCGHFHGGQFWAPFDLEFRLLRPDTLCKKGYKRGLYIINGICMYISRGLGGVFVPMRFMSRPEITVFTLP